MKGSYLFNMWALLVLVFLFFQFFIRLHVFHFDQSFLINNKLTLSLRQQRPPAVICTDQCVCCLAYKQGLHNTRLQQLRVNDDTKKTLENYIFSFRSSSWHIPANRHFLSFRVCPRVSSTLFPKERALQPVPDGNLVSDWEVLKLEVIAPQSQKDHEATEPTAHMDSDLVPAIWTKQWAPR